LSDSEISLRKGNLLGFLKPASLAFVTLIDSVYSRNQNQVNIRVVTTSADDWYGGEKFVSQTEIYYDYINSTGQNISTQDSDIFDSQTIPVNRRKELELMPPLESRSGKRVFEFNPTMSSHDFSELKSELIDLIEEIGTDGSDKERGLCSFGRVLQSSNSVNG